MRASLRWQLGIWSLLVLLVLLACQGLWLWQAGRESRKEAQQAALSTAEAYAGMVREALQQGYDAVSFLSLQLKQNQSLQSCQNLLDDQLTPLDKAQFSDFSVVVFDATGQARCHYGNLLTATHTADTGDWNIGKRRFFQRAKAELGTRVSGYLQGTQFREPVMAVSTPILRQGAFAGLIIYTMPARYLTQLAMTLHLPQNGWVWLLDRERRLAANSDEETDWQSPQFAQTRSRLAGLVDGHCPGTMPWRDHGADAIIACHRLETTATQWLADAGMVLVRWDQPALFDSGRLSYLLIPIVAGIPFLLLFWLGNHWGLLRPLEELTERLKKRRAVRESHEMPMWLRELKELGQHIRRMQRELEHVRLEKIALGKELEATQETLASREKELADRLRKAQLLKILFDHAPEGLMRLDLHKRCCKAANMAFCRMSGLDVDEVAGRPLTALYPPEAHEQINTILAAQEQGQQIEALGVPMQKADGSVWYADITAVPLRTTQYANQEAIAVFHDATARVRIEQIQARRRIEEGVRVSLLRILLTPQTEEERNRAFLGQLADFVQGSLALYRQVDANQMRLLAHVGTMTFQENLFLTEGLDGQTPLIAHQDQDNPRISTQDQPAQSLRLHPIGHGSQILGYLVAAMTSQTKDDQERLDKLLTWSAGQLATTWISMDQRERLARYAREQEEQARLLAQTNQELERANRTKDDFLSTMSHELRTPLNAIIGFSEVLRDGLAGPMSPDQLDYTLEILRAGQHLLELINDILDLAKIEAGRMELDASPADIGELCQTVQRMVRERAANKNITLTLQSGAEVATKLMLDQRKVKQILLNLLSNAIKFTPAGGSIVLRCSKVDSQQILDHRFDPGFRAPPHAIAPGSYLELRVQDSGVGISLENLKRLFAPFEQLDSSLSRHYEGTGLGLSLVKRFAELHGGLVHVASAPGEGSIFTVWLPWQEVVATSLLQRMVCSAKDAQGRRRVLMVEDDPAAARLMALWFEQLGWDVEHAVTAEEALRQATATPPDVITVDIMLPGMDGWNLLQRLRAKETLAHIPVLVVSVVASEAQGRAYGATAVANKPLSQDDLLAVLRRSGLMGAPLRVVMLTGQHPSILEVRHALEQEGHAVQVVHNKKDLEAILGSWHPDVVIFDLSFADHLAFDALEVSGEWHEHAPPFILALQGDDQWLYQSTAEIKEVPGQPLGVSRVLLDIMQQADPYPVVRAKGS